MKFHLQFPIPPFTEKLNYRQTFLSIGSCFAENIGELMQNNLFNITINPNGIVYNPASIGIALRRYCTGTKFIESDLFFANDLWNSWEHHSVFSHPDKEATLNALNQSVKNAHNTLLNAEWLMITFGSAYYYQLNDSGKIVANCHKQKQQIFTKHLLTVNEIVDDHQQLIQQLHSINPNLKIVFSISPVRYKRDGVMENTRSKARLIEAVHSLVETNNATSYFPAYELVLDDLRDYRFFKEDLVHPNQVAINYVFDKWKETIFDEETKGLFERIKSLVADCNHRPLHASTASHQEFITATRLRATKLKEEFPFLPIEQLLPL